jgi:hypothetical protein
MFLKQSLPPLLHETDPQHKMILGSTRDGMSAAYSQVSSGASPARKKGLSVGFILLFPAGLMLAVLLLVELLPHVTAQWQH